MNLRKVIPISQYEEFYLYELLEDYWDAGLTEEKDEILNRFFSSVWRGENHAGICTKKIHFKIRSDLLQTDLGQLFQNWTDVEYRYYRAMAKDCSWRSILRQKINNLYTRYFDREVILGKEYMDLIKRPKQLYYQWISGVQMDVRQTAAILEDAAHSAREAKKRLQMEKMTLSWDEYAAIVERILRRALENCRPLEEFEDRGGLSSRFDFITEDHFYVKYLNTCLDGGIRDFQKKYYGVGKRDPLGRCANCGALFAKNNNKQKYCKACAREVIKAYDRKRKSVNRNLPFSPDWQGPEAFILFYISDMKCSRIYQSKKFEMAGDSLSNSGTLLPGSSRLVTSRCSRS